jgi:hypothetical protein
MNKYARLRCARIALMATAGVAALGAVVMGLWNWLIPSLFFGAHEIGYLQAIGVLLLSRILFGGFRGRGGHRHAALTEEERAKFKSRWCCTPRDAQTDPS